MWDRGCAVRWWMDWDGVGGDVDVEWNREWNVYSHCFD